MERILRPKTKQTKEDWENRMLEREYQREEEVEDTLINDIIRKEVDKNFALYCLWSCQYGQEEANHRQRCFVAKLNSERGRLIHVRRLREQQGLRSCDVVDQIRSVREVNTVVNGVKDLTLNPLVVPPSSRLNGRLMNKIKEKMETGRPITRGSVLNMESALR